MTSSSFSSFFPPSLFFNSEKLALECSPAMLTCRRTLSPDRRASAGAALRVPPFSLETQEIAQEVIKEGPPRKTAWVGRNKPPRGSL